VGSKEMVPKPQIDSLTELGFVVIIPNYRLCPQISVFDGPVADAKDALIWSRTKLPGLLSEEGIIVDPERVAALGHSAGGGLALLLVSLFPLAHPISRANRLTPMIL
jgi:acetyl esterase/lipase